MMKTHEEIKKGLECCAVDACFGERENCPYTADPTLCVGVMCEDALTYIQQLEARVPRWIPVEERLPDEGVDVVIRYGKDGFCEVASRSGENWHCAEYVVLGGEWITHWMPLPEPPEEVQADGIP